MVHLTRKAQAKNDRGGLKVNMVRTEKATNGGKEK